MSEYFEREPPETVAIVGGGYVGVEMAEAFRAWDLETHLYQRSGRPAPPFGEAVGDELIEYLDDAGVELHLDTEVEALEGDDRIERVEEIRHAHDVDHRMARAEGGARSEGEFEVFLECRPVV
jgi:pyruvate/2-oxoglutarate dehydrogenase complex dihydrolipoamide dehydrogenase (E3) component